MAIAFLLFFWHAAATDVVTFSDLQSAIVDGADINILSDMTFTESITVANTVSISSSSGATLDGNEATRFFIVESYGVLNLVGLTLKRGYDGNCYSDTCYAGQGFGGAVYVNSGTLTISECTFTGNTAPYGADDDNAGEAKGGAIFASGGQVTATKCTFTANDADQVSDTPPRARAPSPGVLPSCLPFSW